MRTPFAIAFFFLLCFAQICFTGLYASNRVAQLEMFGIDDGLSQTAISCVMQDSQGFLWIGTQDGLNRFDGYSFKSYRNLPNDSTSLANNNIVSLQEDENGNIWIGTWDGLSCLNRNSGKFVNYHHNPSNPNSISANKVFYVYQDKLGTIWVKTLESMDRFNPSTGDFTRFPHYSDYLTTATQNNDYVIYEDSFAQLWVGTKDGLLLFDRNLGLYKRYANDRYLSNSISSNRVKDVYEDSSKNLWVATDVGLNLFRRKTNDFVRYLNNPSVYGSLPNNIVNFIFEDSKKNLWVGTDAGLCRFDRASQSFSSIIQVFANGNMQYATSYTDMIEDNSSILWVGTLTGLLKWDLKEPKFNLYRKNDDGSNIFSSNFIASVLSESNGQLWVGTWGAGIHSFNRITKKNEVYTSTSSSRRIANDYVHAITRTSAGELLIGTRNGVQVYNPRSQTFSDFFKSKNIPNASQRFFDNRVYSIKEDKNGNLWFATRVGLHMFNGKELRSFFHSASDTNSISSSETHAIAFDRDGSIWVGSFNGLNKIDHVSYKVKRFLKPSKFKVSSLVSNEILSLLVSSDGTLWVGTSSGLHRYNRTNGEFLFYSDQEGLPNNLINTLEEDLNGNIWMSTNWGIAMLNPRTEAITTYSVSDGLQSNEFNLGASCRTADGEIFFGGVLGLNSFYPDSIRLNTAIPRIAITSIELIGAQGKKIVPFNGDMEVLIEEDFSMINIEFSALDFTRPHKNEYMYRMEGLEDRWIALGNRRMASFSHLKEGTYILKVKGSNSDRIWNEEGISLRIIIKTNFWRSKVANALYWGVFIVSMFIFLRTRTKILRRTKRLLKERGQAMVEIEQQKEELVVKNKSITDSIVYAKRIQEAIMPSEVHFRRIIPDSFILYLPKDIVSGDFYWVNETHNKIFIAAVDCTGHGVPGAFMSIIGIELLRNITNVQGINDAAEILNRLHKGVNETFGKGIDDETVVVKDGMDVSFCVLDKENNTFQFAGAFTSLYLIRNSKITEIKGDRYSVGMGNEEANSQFTSHVITVEPDDMIYIFTDGYVDQFGGPEGKKFKFRRFRHLLLSVHKLPLDDQKRYIYESIREWRGNLEQVDDILIIGIKPDLSCLF